MTLKEKILRKKAKVGIIGLGYVGLPEAVAVALAGFRVVGFDVDERKVDSVNNRKLYISDIDKKEFLAVVKKGLLTATTDSRVLRNADVICICVPTPFNVYKEPDLTDVINATNSIKQNMGKGQLIILESTTYPGTTREILMPIFEKGGLKTGKDFYLAFSPERIDPGNEKYRITNTPKVIGGITKKCTELGYLFYSSFIIKSIPVSSPETAEMTKLLENIFRNVNIALVNELMLLCNRMKLDIWEIVEAAKSKPFGFMSFMPGPGVGGHCIPVDPVYLSWKAKEYDFTTRFIELAAEINYNMPYHVVSRILSILQGKLPEKSKVLIMGVAFKKDISDVRNSPALKVIELLMKERVNVFFNDPFAGSIKINGKVIKSSRLTPKFCRNMDCVVVITNHSNYDYEWVLKNCKVLFDTRNATKGVKINRHKIIKI